MPLYEPSRVPCGGELSAKGKLIVSFVALAALVGVAALGSIFYSGLTPRVVVPVAGFVMAIAVWEFAARFNTVAAPSDEERTRRAESENAGDAGIKLLQILMIALGFIFVLNVVTFVVEAWKGVLDPDDLRRFVPKALFAFALIGYILKKIGSKTRF